MGRKTDHIDENSVSISSARQMNENSDQQTTEDTSINDNGDDLLIHDRILPHRKRIRKDALHSLPTTMPSETISKVGIID